MELWNQTDPSAKRAVYDVPRLYTPSLTMMDIQMNHVTRCSLPAHDGEEGWCYDFGDEEATTEDKFEVSNVINAGR